MQRITDLWRNLVRYHPPPREENPPEVYEEEEEDEREAEISEAYRNLYWTRLISLQRGQDQRFQRWALAQDIVECLQEIDGLEQIANDSPEPIFDPAEFQQREPEPSKQAYTLPDEELEKWAKLGTRVRAQIKEKAEVNGSYLEAKPESIV